ncbi:MAG: spore coat protein U domain-containing protein [Hyphomicrobiaceae bacterium]
MLKKIVIAAVAVAALGSNGAFAAGASTVAVNGGSLSVNATIVPSCQVAIGSAVAFGSITIVPGATATPGTFTVTCDLGTDYAVGLGNGNNFTATRNMISGGNVLPYELFVDNSYLPASRFNNVTLGDTVGGAPATGTYGGTGSGSSVSYDVYGQIPATATKPAPGFYGDSVAVTVIY